MNIPANEWREEFRKQFIREGDGLLDIGKYDDRELMDFIQKTLDQHSAHLVERIEKHAGKLFGIEIIVNEDIKNTEYSAGFEAGKKYMKDQAIDIVKSKSDKQEV